MSEPDQVRTPVSETTCDPIQGEGPAKLACSTCGEEFDARFSQDGAHCFTCSVHLLCSCSHPEDS